MTSLLSRQSSQIKKSQRAARMRNLKIGSTSNHPARPQKIAVAAVVKAKRRAKETTTTRRRRKRAVATRQAPDARVWSRLLLFRARVPCGVVVFFGAVTSSQQGRHGGNSRLLIYLLYYLKTHSTANKPKKTQQLPEGAVEGRGLYLPCQHL